jgi:hypothetical protein
VKELIEGSLDSIDLHYEFYPKCSLFEHEIELLVEI